MKKNNHILRPSEISLTDLIMHLLKNCWVAILIALAAAMTAWSVLGTSLPESYSESVTLSVRSTYSDTRWSNQFSTSRTYAQNLTNLINNATVSTDFASAALNRQINATVSATHWDPTNWVSITVTAATPEETYLYLVQLVDNIDQLPVKAGLPNAAVDVVAMPAMPDVSPDYTSSVLMSVAAALVAGVLACVLVIAIPIVEGRLSTRKAAERLSLLPLAGFLNKGGKGRGLDANLPPVNAENADGNYANGFSKAAEYLLSQVGAASKTVRVSALLASSGISNQKKKESMARSADRIAMNLALAMSNTGAKICLIDPRGEALAALGIALNKDKHYSVNSRLTVSLTPLDDAQASAYDCLITASEGKTDGELRLWTLEAGSANASQVNEFLLKNGVKSKESLLVYGARTVHDTYSSTESGRQGEDDGDDIDVLRWAAASLKALWRIRFKAIAWLAFATVAALSIVFASRMTDHQLCTTFTVLTPDVSGEYTPDELSAMTYADAIEQMEASAAATQDFNGNALYPTARPIDYDLMMSILPEVWNLEPTAERIADQLGVPSISEKVSVTLNDDNVSFTLTVSGSDRERLETVSQAFFAIAPNLSEHTADGLVFKTGESVESAAGISVVSVLVPAWAIVIMGCAVYMLIVGFNDRRLYLRYEFEEITACKVLGSLSHGSVREVGLARHILDWVSSHPHGSLLMITSALGEEGCDEITAAIEAQLKQSAKVTVIDRASLSEIERLKSEYDYILLNAPAITLDGDADEWIALADSILMVVRKGYADRERIAWAIGKLGQTEKLSGCLIVKK